VIVLAWWFVDWTWSHPVGPFPAQATCEEFNARLSAVLSCWDDAGTAPTLDASPAPPYGRPDPFRGVGPEPARRPLPRPSLWR
jgi:hypothetical protein